MENLASETLLTSILALVAVGLLVFAVLTSRSRSALSRHNSELREKAAMADHMEVSLGAALDKLAVSEKAREEAETRLARIETQMQAVEKNHAERLADMEKAREQLKETFKLTANEILKTSGEELSKSSKESMDLMLNPLRDQLKEFREKVEKDSEKRVEQTTSLKELTERLHDDAKQMAEDANNLANALRSSSKMQGDWGELILTSILERAGLRKGHEFHEQSTTRDDDGKLIKPDIVVDMPDGNRLVIDSKVSLTAFDRCVNADTEAERDAALNEHLASVRRHIEELGDRNYAEQYPGVSFTLMFIPLEGAASLALQSDMKLVELAARHEVMIATPTNLMMAMRTIANLWTIDRQNQNAREIAVEAGRLYDKLVGFVSDLETVGSRLDSTKKAWSDARKKLVDGRGNAIGKAEKLKQMGAQTNKSLADALGVDHIDDPLPALEAGPENET